MGRGGTGKKQNRKTTVSEVNVTEKVRHHRSPSRNHNHFLEEDIKKEKPQPKVQRELKENKKACFPDHPILFTLGRGSLLEF